MKKKEVYELHVDKISESIYIDVDEDCSGNVESLEKFGEEEAMKQLECNRPMLSTLRMIQYDTQDLARLIKQDMIDLYKKIEALEK